MTAWLAIAAMEMRAFLRSKAALFWTFLYPILLLVILGALFAGTSKAYLITGMAALTVISTALFGFTGVLIELRARGSLIPLQLMPIGRMQYLTAFAASRLAILTVFAVVFVLAADQIYQAGLVVTPTTLATFTGLTALGAIAFLGVGLVIAAFVTQPTVAQALINIVNLPIIFLSDLFIPVSSLPGWLQQLVSWSPINGFVSGLRQVLDAGGQPASATAWTASGLAVLGAAGFATAAGAFCWRVK